MYEMKLIRKNMLYLPVHLSIVLFDPKKSKYCVIVKYYSKILVSFYT